MDYEKCQFCCTKLNDVCVKKGEDILLDRITMHIHCNQITAIVGPNGAGKTTLFKALLGEIPYEGSIEYVTHKGKPKKYAPTIGYVPQQLNFDRQTPISVIDLFASCTQKKPVWLGINKEFKAKVMARLQEVGMAQAIDKKIGTLSGGELQKVLVALALMPTPDILMLDEPISGVDMQGKHVFYDTLQNLKKKHHMAIIIITHDIPILDEICDRAILLNKKILAEGDPKELLGNKIMIDTFGQKF